MDILYEVVSAFATTGFSAGALDLGGKMGGRRRHCNPPGLHRHLPRGRCQTASALPRARLGRPPGGFHRGVKGFVDEIRHPQFQAAVFHLHGVVAADDEHGDSFHPAHFPHFGQNRKAVAKPFNILMMEFQAAIMEVETRLKVLNAQFSQQFNRNPFESIKSRLKTPESIYEKLERKGYPVTVEI